RLPSYSTLLPYTTLFRSGGTLTWNITTAEPANVDRNASKADTPRARPLTSLRQGGPMGPVAGLASHGGHIAATPGGSTELLGATDRKSTRLNSSHVKISY